MSLLGDIPMSGYREEPSPEEPLRDRYLAGEIDVAEYEQALDEALGIGMGDPIESLLDRIRAGLQEIADPDGGANSWAFERAVALLVLIKRETGR